MRIAIISQICNAKSGARAPIELAKALAKKNSVYFYATDQSYDPEIHQSLTKSSVNVRLIKTNRLPIFGKWLTGLKANKLIRQGQPQIISAHCMLPLLIGAKLTRLPIISTYYGTQLNAYSEKLLPSQKPNPIDKILNWLGNQIILFIGKLHFKLSDQVVAISQYTQNEVKKLTGRTVPYVYLGTNFSNLNLIPNKQLPTTGNRQPITILSVSRFTPYKGFHHLIEVFNQLCQRHSKLKLVIAGSLGSQKHLNYLKEIAGDRIEFVVNCSDEKLTRLYQSCDMYATCDRYLFFGLPIIEAAGFGKPSVALKYCAAPEVIAHGKTGFVAMNLNEMEKYLEKLIQEPNLRESLGKNAYKRAEEIFNWQKTASGYESVLRQALSPSN